MENKIAVFGGSLMKRLISELGGKNVEEKCMWIHPLSLNEENLIDELNSKEMVAEFLKNSKSEYLLIELSSIRMALFKTPNGNYYRSEDIKNFSEESQNKIVGEVVSIESVPDAQIEYCISTLCDLIRDSYSADKVCLISAVPMMGMINQGEYYIPSSGYWINVCKIIKKIEQRIYEKLECKYIEEIQWHIPKDKSDSYKFYDCFYKNIETEIKDFLNNETRIVRDSKQDSRYFYVAKTFRSLYRKQAHKMLLDYNNPVDYCVSCSNEDFIYQYNDILIKIRNINFKTTSELKKYLIEQPSNICYTKLISMINISNNVNCKLEDIINVKDLCIIDFLCKRLGSEIHKYVPSFCEKAITRNNVISYFVYLDYIKLNNINFTEGRHNKIKCLLDQVKKPILVDIFGSCLSRFIFNYAEELDDSLYVVNEYVFHANPLDINGDGDNTAISKLLNENIYEERNLKIQVDGKVREKYMESKSEWVIIDFYTLYAEHIFKSDKRNYIIGNKLGNKFFPDGKTKSIYKSYQYDDILEGIKEFAKFVVERYDEKIILISSRNSETYRNNDKLVHFDNLEEIRAINVFLDKIENAFVSMTDCYYIKINQFFYPDDKQISVLTPYHYERELYLTEYKLIRQICEGSFLSYNKQIDSKNIKMIAEKN